MVFQNNLLAGVSGATGTTPFDTTLIGNSAWFNGTDSRMDSPSFSAQVDPTCFTFATWVKINSFSVTNGQYIWSAERSGNYAAIGFDANDKLFAYSNPATFTSDMVFRDIGWYHIICSYKGAANTVRMFVNGVEITNTASNTLASPNPEPVAHSHTQRIGAYYVGATGGDLYETDAYLAQTVFLDGFSFQDGDISVTDFLDTFTFGTNGSQFIPKKDSELATLAGTAGANSYVLDYADSSALGNDISSKDNNFTLTNLSSANQSESTPSNTYATWNPIFGPFAGHTHTATLTEGNLRLASSTSNYSVTTSSLAMPAGSGKFAAKFTVNTLGGIYPVIGVFDMDGDTTSSFTGSSDSVGLRMDGQKYVDGSSSSYGSAVSAGNTVEVELDLDNNTVEFLINGSAQGTISKTFTGTVVFMVQDGSNGSAIDVTAEFDYTPDDSSFKTLNTANLTAPDYQGIDYFDATIYEGNGAGQRVGDFVPFTDVGTITKSFLCDGNTNSGTTDLTISTSVSTAPTDVQVKTLSFWIKPVSVREQHVYNASTDATDSTDSSERIYIATNGEVAYQTRQTGSAVALAYTAGAEINDASQWYNVVVALNYDSSTASANTLKIYVNGVEQTLDNNSGGSATLPAPGMTTEAYINKASTRQLIGTHPGFTSAGSRSNCYLAEMYMVDGQALTASAFGVLDTSTNRWVPKAPATIKSTITGTGAGFGGCGFYLDFLDASDLGDDDSGNNRDFTESATIGAENQVADVPSKNYAVYNTVKGAVYTAMSMSEGNLTTKSGNGSVALAAGFPIQDGYWYYEVNFVEDAANMVFGLYNPATTVTASDSNPTLTGIKENGGTVVIEDNGASNSIAGPTLSNPSAGDVVGIYIRKVGNSYGMWFSLNGTAMNNTPAATATATPDIGFAASMELVPAAHYTNLGTKEAQTNFGQLLRFDGGSTSFDSDSDGNWKHAPVTGFKALNQDNLDETASKLTAWAWIKNRDATDNHILVDRVRGVGKVLSSNNASSAEAINTNTVQRFFQRGVQIGSDAEVNTDNESYVLWQWLLGDSATTGSSITTGSPSLTTTGIVADADHFSIISYTGSGSNATVAHGLSAAPEMYIVRDRTDGNDWNVYHENADASPASGSLRLDSNAAFLADPTIWNGVPTATIINLGTSDETNKLNNNFITYCFRSIPGVCKVGSYVGNGDDNGAYISLGFRPRWILLKSTTTARDWPIFDTARDPTNVADQRLDASSNAAEFAAALDVDFLADGWKFRSDDIDGNASGVTYIYLAMADIAGNGTLPPIYGR